MSPMEIAILVIAAVLVVALVVGGWYLWRHQSLRRRFGPEYRRLAKQEGPLAAERELRGRERRHATLQLRELDDRRGNSTERRGRRSRPGSSTLLSGRSVRRTTS